MSLRRKLVTTVLWDPATWVPLTIATAITCLLRLPWWANVISCAAAFGAILTIWGALLPRLTTLWETEETAAFKQAEEDKRQALVKDLAAHGLRKIADCLATAYQLREAILARINENEWLSSYDYGRNALALILEIETEARKLVAEKSEHDDAARRSQKTALEKEKSEAIAQCLEALEDTLKTLEKTIVNIKESSEVDAVDGKSLAEEIKNKNKITRRVLAQSEDTETQKE